MKSEVEQDEGEWDHWAGDSCKQGTRGGLREGEICGDFFEIIVPGRGNSERKGPEAGTGWVHLTAKGPLWWEVGSEKQQIG